MDLFGLPIGFVLQGGAVALLGATFWLVMTGRLVPRSTIEDIKSDRDNWRLAHERVLETNRVQADQLNELLELSRTTSEVIRALPVRQFPKGGLR